MKTKSLKSDEIRKDWYVANAEGKTLGRFASEVAKVLREIPVWTNFIYLLGAMYAYVHNMKTYALMFLVISIVSTIHHVYSERYLKNKTMRKIFYYADVVIC